MICDSEAGKHIYPLYSLSIKEKSDKSYNWLELNKYLEYCQYIKEKKKPHNRTPLNKINDIITNNQNNGILIT